MCKILNVSRSAYNRWVKHPYSPRRMANNELAKTVRAIHDEHPDMGYRRIKDELKRTYDQNVNDKRVLRICREEKIQSSIKHPANSITKRGRHPYYVAENILNRDFSATAPNTKWVTDITEFKYYIGLEVHKVYLSAILDLYDRRIVVSLLTSSARGTTYHWYWIPLIRHDQLNLMHSQFSTVIVDFNIPIKKCTKELVMHK